MWILCMSALSIVHQTNYPDGVYYSLTRFRSQLSWALQLWHVPLDNVNTIEIVT
jgi:hypothetical protein